MTFMALKGHVIRQNNSTIRFHDLTNIDLDTKNRYPKYYSNHVLVYFPCQSPCNRLL